MTVADDLEAEALALEGTQFESATMMEAAVMAVSILRRLALSYDCMGRAALVEAAFREGWAEGEGGCQTPALAWECSESCAALRHDRSRHDRD